MKYIELKSRGLEFEEAMETASNAMVVRCRQKTSSGFTWVYLVALSALLFISSINALTPDESMKALKAGNANFVAGNPTHKSYSEEAKNALLEGQAPIAAIVGCSDSRVPPEIVFDLGLGQLFTVRVAGNVVGPVEMDSVEFAVKGLNVPLVVVLGHQNCGAVKAALAGVASYPDLETIIPMIDVSLKNCASIGNNRLQSAIYCNVQHSVALLKKSATIAPLVKSGKVKILGAYYDIATGRVSFIGNQF